MIVIRMNDLVLYLITTVKIGTLRAKFKIILQDMSLCIMNQVQVFVFLMW